MEHIGRSAMLLPSGANRPSMPRNRRWPTSRLARSTTQMPENQALSGEERHRLPYTVCSPKVWKVSHEMPLGSLTQPLLPRA